LAALHWLEKLLLLRVNRASRWPYGNFQGVSRRTIIGLLAGKLAEMLFKMTDNRLVETTITIPVALDLYTAEQLGEWDTFRGGCCIYLGTVIPANTSPTTKIALYNFWEVTSFIVTSLIFLIIGCY
jgi:NhaP-type Na+/H+ or K+/H+ antiporter